MNRLSTQLNHALEFDHEKAFAQISDFIRINLRELNKRGLIVAISGGVDSAVCAALSVQAIGKDRVYGLLLPEKDSSITSIQLGKKICRMLGIKYQIKDIASTLEAVGCYEQRDQAIRSLYPDYAADWSSKIVIDGGLSGGINHFDLVVKDPDQQLHRQRLPLAAYLQIVAATNYKQRMRKSIEYYHADRLNYAVVGTPNRLEYDQGFFVKNGDGAADIKPIAHLYKSQVYALCETLGLPNAVSSSRPTTDTYSLPQSQEEFYFALPYEQMDIALWAFNNKIDSAGLAMHLGISKEDADMIFKDIAQKRRTSNYLHAPAKIISVPPDNF